MGHENDDRLDIKSAPHDTGFLKTLITLKKMSPTGDQWNVSVISPEEFQRDEPTWVPIDKGWRRAQKYCQYLRTGTERGRNIKLVMAKFS